MKGYPINDWAQLTPRQFLVACRVCNDGQKPSEIARELGVHRLTVQHQLAVICRKLGVRRHQDLAMLAHGWNR
jgi:DNA-binding CsgD family transcriptional regulator